MPFFVFFVSLWYVPSRTAFAAELRIPYERYRTANGLTVILHEDHAAPQVVVNIWYGVGSENERPGKTGFAHLFEHLMFMGSRDAPEGVFDQLTEAEGGFSNASTAEDRTNFYEQGPSHLLETFLWLEADRMATLGMSLSLDQLNRQREVVRNERRESYENQPYGAAELLLPAALYPRGHPYSWPVIGSHADLTAASLADVRQFFTTFYTPSNASLVIAGDFEPAAARGWVEHYFGWIPSAPKPPSPQAGPVRLAAPRRITVTDRVALPRLTMVWHSPAYYAPGDAECDVLAEILGRGKSSRLYRELVYRRQVAQDVEVSQDSNRLGSLFTIEVTASAGHRPADLERAVDAQLARLRASPPTARELQRARNRIEADFVRELEPLAQRADQLNHYQFYLGDPGAIGRDLERYRRVTPAGLQRVAASLLRPQARLVLRVLPGLKSHDSTDSSHRRGAEDAEKGDESPVPEPQLAAFPLRPLRLCGESSGAQASAPVPEFMTRRPSLGPPQLVRIPAAHRFRLPNGLEVVLVERHTLPLVEARITFREGADADPPSRVGLASMVSAMLDEGAGQRSSPQIADQLDFLAAELEESADYQESMVQLSALKQSLRQAFDLFADVVLRPRFEPRELARVRKERLADLAQQRTEPEEVARLVFRRALYGDRHPFGRPLEGYPATIRSVRQSDLRRFHQTIYRPNQAFLVVVGDLTPAELRPLVERSFGAWRSRQLSALGARRSAKAGLSQPRAERRALRAGYPPERSEGRVPQRPRLVMVPFAGAPQSVLRIGHPGPSRLSPAFPALEALNVILGGAFTSRLNQNLRERHGYTYGAGSMFAWQRGPGPFVVATSVFRNQTGPALVECLSELEKIRQGPITDEEVRKARATVRQSRVRELAELGGTLEVFSDNLFYHLPADDTVRLLARLDGLTVADLHRVAARELHPDRATVVIVGDPKTVRAALAMPALAASRLGPPQIRDAEGTPMGGAIAGATTKAPGTK